MPIRFEGLDDSEKFHIAVKGNTPWAAAAAALKQKAGNPSWPLVVKKSDGTYAAVQFKTLLEADDIPPDTQAENLPGLTPVEVLKVSAMGTDAARDHVSNMKGPKLAVVVDDSGKFMGTIGKGAHRGDGGLPTSKLDQLAGQNVDLSKLGDFLLDE